MRNVTELTEYKEFKTFLEHLKTLGVVEAGYIEEGITTVENFVYKDETVYFSYPFHYRSVLSLTEIQSIYIPDGGEIEIRLNDGIFMIVIPKCREDILKTLGFKDTFSGTQN